MELQKFSNELQELTSEQACEINGGESLWYWIAYGVGATAHAVSNGVSALANGVSAVHNALKQPDYLIGVK